MLGQLIKAGRVKVVDPARVDLDLDLTLEKKETRSGSVPHKSARVRIKIRPNEVQKLDVQTGSCSGPSLKKTSGSMALVRSTMHSPIYFYCR